MPSECKCNPRTPFCLERRRGRDLRCVRCANAYKYQADVKPTCACDSCWDKWRSHLEFVGAGDLGDPQTASAAAAPPPYPPEHEAPSVVSASHNWHIATGSHLLHSPNSATFSVTPRGCSCATTLPCKLHNPSICGGFVPPVEVDHEYIGLTREPTPTLPVEPVQMDLFLKAAQPHRFRNSD